MNAQELWLWKKYMVDVISVGGCMSAGLFMHNSQRLKCEWWSTTKTSRSCTDYQTEVINKRGWSVQEQWNSSNALNASLEYIANPLWLND